MDTKDLVINNLAMRIAQLELDLATARAEASQVYKALKDSGGEVPEGIAVEDEAEAPGVSPPEVEDPAA